jgi:hypothetical protein
MGDYRFGVKQVSLPYWHEISKLSMLQEFVKEFVAHEGYVDNWRMKYLNVRIDTRNGAFTIQAGNATDPTYLQLVINYEE